MTTDIKTLARVTGQQLYSQGYTPWPIRDYGLVKLIESALLTATSSSRQELEAANKEILMLQQWIKNITNERDAANKEIQNYKQLHDTNELCINNQLTELKSLRSYITELESVAEELAERLKYLCDVTKHWSDETKNSNVAALTRHATLKTKGMK